MSNLQYEFVSIDQYKINHSLGRSDLLDQSILKIDNGLAVNVDKYSSCSQHTWEPFVIIVDFSF